MLIGLLDEEDAAAAMSPNSGGLGGSISMGCSRSGGLDCALPVLILFELAFAGGGGGGGGKGSLRPRSALISRTHCMISLSSAAASSCQ